MTFKTGDRVVYLNEDSVYFKDVATVTDLRDGVEVQVRFDRYENKYAGPHDGHTVRIVNLEPAVSEEQVKAAIDSILGVGNG